MRVSLVSRTASPVRCGRAGVGGGAGVEGGEGAIRLGVGRLDRQPVAGGEAEDQLQPVSQAAHRQHLVGRHAIDGGHADGEG